MIAIPAQQNKIFGFIMEEKDEDRPRNRLQISWADVLKGISPLRKRPMRYSSIARFLEPVVWNDTIELPI